jgi:membrane dipeptidase
MDRRSLLALAVSAAGAAAISYRVNGAIADNPIHGWVVINSCGGFDEDTDLRRGGSGPPTSTVTINRQTLQDALASGMNAANQSIGYVFGEGDPFEQTVRAIGLWDALIRNDPDLIKVYTTQDIERARNRRQLGIILGFQNAAMLGDQVDRIDIFAELGIKIIQLTYNNQNRLGGGSLTPGNPGLTHFGQEVVARLNAERLIVDLSHSGAQVCLDAARVSAQPVAVTHTGCRALVDHPRNTTDEGLRLVASKGGYVGIYFMPFLASGRNANAGDLIAHLEHAINVCGEDHVGIGTDGGTSKIDIESYKAAHAKLYATRVAAGITAPGERADSLSFIPELSGPDQFRTLAGLMAKRGHSAARIEKILGLNFMRYAREIWGA